MLPMPEITAASICETTAVYGLSNAEVDAVSAAGRGRGGHNGIRHLSGRSSYGNTAANTQANDQVSTAVESLGTTQDIVQTNTNTIVLTP